MKQTEQLKDYFQTVTSEITPLIAQKVMGIERLTSRIFDLKKEGYIFSKVMREDFSGKRYAAYQVVYAPFRPALA